MLENLRKGVPCLGFMWWGETLHSEIFLLNINIKIHQRPLETYIIVMLFLFSYNFDLIWQKSQIVSILCSIGVSGWSNVFPCQKEERSVLLGIGCLEFIAEPEPPLLLELQPAHRLPEGASICTDDTQSRPYRGAELSDHLQTVLGYMNGICLILHLWGKRSSWGTQESQRNQRNRAKGH